MIFLLHSIQHAENVYTDLHYCSIECINMIDAKITVKNVPIFSSLDDADIEIIGQYCVQKQLMEHEKLFAMGEPFNQLCMVVSGNIAIYSNSRHNRLIAQYIAGESFGELNLCGISLGDAEAVAVNNAGVLLFPANNSFESFVIQHADIGAKIIYKLLSDISFRIRETNKLITHNYGWVSQLKTAIYTDRLTGLYNRQYCDELFKENMDCIIAVIKPDKFKAINDTCGHKTGDAVLIALAKSIRKAVPDAVHIRMRGDEFMTLLMNDAHMPATGSAILQSIQSINIADITRGAIPFITASVGITKGVFTQHAIDSAYSFMWSSYHSGGNSIVEGQS